MAAAAPPGRAQHLTQETAVKGPRPPVALPIAQRQRHLSIISPSGGMSFGQIYFEIVRFKWQHSIMRVLAVCWRRTAIDLRPASTTRAGL